MAVKHVSLTVLYYIALHEPYHGAMSYPIQSYLLLCYTLTYSIPGVTAYNILCSMTRVSLIKGWALGKLTSCEDDCASTVRLSRISTLIVFTFARLWKTVVLLLNTFVNSCSMHRMYTLYHISQSCTAGLHFLHHCGLIKLSNSSSLHSWWWS